MEDAKGELFEAVFQHKELMVFGIDMEGHIVLFNPACEHLSGYRKEEVLGQRFWDVLIPERTKPDVIQVLDDYLGGKKIVSFVNPWVTKEGKERMIAWSTCSTWDQDGRPAIGLGLGVDITERTEAAERLAQSEAYFRLLIENSLDMVTVLESDGTISYIGPSIRRIMGFSDEELLGRNILEFVHPDDISTAREYLQAALMADGAAGSIEVRVRNKNGEWRIQEADSFNLLSDPNIRGLVVNSRDITDRKRVEDELRESRRTLMTLMGNLPGMAYRCRNDPDWSLEFASEGTFELTGYSPHDFMENATVKYAELIVPEDRERVWSEVQASLSQGKPFQLIYRIRSRDRTIKWVWEQGIGVYSPADEVIFLEGFISDISDRIKAEKLLRLQRDLAITLSGSLDLEEVLWASLRGIFELTGLDCGGIYLVDKDTGALDLAYAEGVSPAFREAVQHYDRDSANAALVRQGYPQYLPYEELNTPRTNARLAEGLKAFAMVPVKVEDQVVACINAASHFFNDIPAQSRDAIEILAGQIGQAIMRARLMVEIRDSEARYRLLHDNAGEAIFMYGTDLRVISINRKACERIGYSEEELVGRNIFELGIVRPADLELVRAGHQSLVDEGEPVRGVFELIRKDGQSLLFDIIAAPLLNDKGEVMAIANIALDITERRLANEALKRSEEELRVTFELTGTAMGILGLDGEILEINQEMEKLLGYTGEEVEGKKKYEEFVAEENLESVRRLGSGLFDGEISGPIQFECDLIERNGKRIDAIVNVALLPGMNKGVFSVIDITEKKQYERLLEERAEQLRDFLDVAAHELRHPATLLKGYAMTLAKSGETMDAEIWSESLQAIETGVDRLVNVVEELLDVSRIERGHFDIVKEQVEIEPLLEGAAAEMRDRGHKGQIRIELKAHMKPAWVDPERFMRLLIILLDNAIRYSPSESPVEIIAENDGQNLIISVLDRGIGIPDEDRNRVFDRFYQVEDALQHGGPGLGLGLYIASRIARAHGGRLSYEPREGGGSAFSFSIPNINGALANHSSLL